MENEGVKLARVKTELIPLDSARPLHTHPVFDRPDCGDLAIVFCHFNPCKYRAPERNLGPFLDGLYEMGVPVYGAELRCGQSLRYDPVLPRAHPRVLQLTSDCVFFQKENLWNLVAGRLPAQYRKVICLDADLIIRPATWLESVRRALDDTPLVQPQSRVVLLRQNGEILSENLSIGYAVGNKLWSAEHRAKQWFQTGRAIAARRDLWEAAGGLYNAPIGGGDMFLTWAVIGSSDELRSGVEAISIQYSDHYRSWAERIIAWSGGRLGYVTADLYHLWHGAFQNRQYGSRDQRLAGYDPATDMAPNPETGLMEWTAFARENKSAMIAAVAEYFTTRLEDQ
jgi:hypothetical protein